MLLCHLRLNTERSLDTQNKYTLSVNDFEIIVIAFKFRIALRHQ